MALLTGGGDRPYALGLASALTSQGMVLDVIGSSELDCPELRRKPGVRFLNLRGDQRPEVGHIEKALRVSRYYLRLISYAATAKPRIFHILWNNKFEALDRTVLMLYYRLLGKRVALTVHNVNASQRDGNDTSLNRLTLRIQYRLADHLFVHTEKMKRDVMHAFGVREGRLTVIPFGINNAVPNTHLTPKEARTRLGLRDGEKTLLFFGNIAPYKGLEYLISAFRLVLGRFEDYRLIIAGRPKGCQRYWNDIWRSLHEDVLKRRVMLRADFIPDDETEVYFKAADVLVLPYRHVYQSGVLFLGYSFGLPALAADVGSLRDDIVEGETGFAFKPEDPVDLARTIERYFASDLFAQLTSRRNEIQTSVTERHSWDVIGQLTISAYARMLQTRDFSRHGCESKDTTSLHGHATKRETPSGFAS